MTKPALDPIKQRPVHKCIEQGDGKKFFDFCNPGEGILQKIELSANCRKFSLKAQTIVFIR
jgi:hypothetical protein